MTTSTPDLFQELHFSPLEETAPAEARPRGELRSGDLCPQCQAGRLDYDCLLNLTCPQCGFAVGGCFT